VDIDALIAALGGRFDAEESVVIERVLREYNGPIPDKQMLSEVGLALAIHRRSSDSPFRRQEDVGRLPTGQFRPATACCSWAGSPETRAPRRRWRFWRRGRG